MTDAPPDPLVPAYVDLRGYEFMPFYGDRAFKSESFLSATASARVAMLRLWWHAYAKEVPAASLPDNDRLLCDYAGYGVVLREWLKVKKQALSGFIKCSDGRLYHRVLSLIAIDRWEYRNSQRNRTENARLARLSQRMLQTDLSPTSPSVTESRGEEKRGDETKAKSNPLAPSDFSLEAGNSAKGRRKNGHLKPFQDGPTVLSIPLIGDKEYEVHQSLVDEFDRNYPAVDVMQTLREIRAWNLSNPNERKTESGVLRHINRWMAKEQNKG